MRRRGFLISLALLVGSVTVAKAKVIWGGMPWTHRGATGPTPVIADGWKFFHADEAAMIEAISDRLIPADDLSIGGKEAGCAVFIDSQLAGPFGQAATQFRLGPFQDGTPQQGAQFNQTPAQRYRIGLAAFDKYCVAQPDGKRFAALSGERQDGLLRQLEKGEIALPGLPDTKAFFSLILGNVREGFFADPIYGGNKDMAGWKMLGFPGARYDYREEIGKRGQKLDIQPISLIRNAGKPNQKAM